MRYIASCSFGKDSLATVILAHIHGEPLDEIVWSEVMFDDETSGELPEFVKWIYAVAIPKLESWGYKVNILRDEETYTSSFLHKVSKSKNPLKNGKLRGFLISGMCVMNDRGKIRPIKQFYKSIKEPVTQYIGIAIDEPKRLERMHKSSNKVSLLEKYNYTEEMAKELCREYGLLAPIYDVTSRGGCWFCPNQRLAEWANLYKNHFDLFEKLSRLAELPNKVTEKITRTRTWNQLVKDIRTYIMKEEFLKNKRKVK